MSTFQNEFGRFEIPEITEHDGGRHFIVVGFENAKEKADSNCCFTLWQVDNNVEEPGIVKIFERGCGGWDLVATPQPDFESD